MAGKQMIGRFACVIVAMGSFSLNGAIGLTPTGVSLRENNTGQAGPSIEPRPAAPTKPGARQTQPGGNPLWGIPLDELAATRERPLFSVSRRPPPPPVAAQPMAEPPPPPPAEPERPPLMLSGTVIGEPQNIALVQDQITKTLVRLHAGEAISGWFLRLIEARIVTVEKNDQTVALALPPVGNASAMPPLLAEATEVARQFRALKTGGSPLPFDKTTRNEVAEGKIIESYQNLWKRSSEKTRADILKSLRALRAQRGKGQPEDVFKN